MKNKACGNSVLIVSVLHETRNCHQLRISKEEEILRFEEKEDKKFMSSGKMNGNLVGQSVFSLTKDLLEVIMNLE